MSSNVFSLMSDDYLIATALQRDSLTDLESELLKRLESAFRRILLSQEVATALGAEVAHHSRTSPLKIEIFRDELDE